MRRIVKHIPNTITCLRVVFCFLLLHYFFGGKYRPALWAFGLAALTDLLDGFTARHLQSMSRIGSFLDPICDKIFSIVIFSLLMAFGYCPPWFLGLHIAATMLQVIGWMAVRLPEGVALPFRPLRLGQWNTALQFFWMGLMFTDLCLKEIRIGPTVTMLGYLTLTSIQVTVFFLYFFEVHPSLARYFHPSIAETA